MSARDQGVPLMLGESHGWFYLRARVGEFDMSKVPRGPYIAFPEPGVWFPLSARAELRAELVRLLMAGIDQTYLPRTADAVLALIFGGDQ